VKQFFGLEQAGFVDSPGASGSEALNGDKTKLFFQLCEFLVCQKNVFAQPMHTIRCRRAMYIFTQHLSTNVHISGLFFSTGKDTFVFLRNFFGTSRRHK
jgi:hypothetical protein